MLSDGGGGKEGEDDETDGDRVSSIPLPSGQPPSTSAGKQISDKNGKLDLVLIRGTATRFGFGLVAPSNRAQPSTMAVRSRSCGHTQSVAPYVRCHER